MRNFIQYCKDEYPIVLMTILAIVVGVAFIGRNIIEKSKEYTNDHKAIALHLVHTVVLTTTDDPDVIGYISVAFTNGTLIVGEIVATETVKLNQGEDNG